LTSPSLPNHSRIASISNDLDGTEDDVLWDEKHDKLLVLETGVSYTWVYMVANKIPQNVIASTVTGFTTLCQICINLIFVENTVLLLYTKLHATCISYCRYILPH